VRMGTHVIAVVGATATGLESELAELGPAALHARLARLDPAAAAAILPSNGRRIVRAHWLDATAETLLDDARAAIMKDS
jgi:tRNA A37 N6-isopentenylltransferase MiaA